MFGHLQINGVGRCAHFRGVVLVDAGGEGACANGVLGAQAEGEFDSLTRRESIEVEDGLGGSQRKFLQAAVGLCGGLLLKGLQVFGEQLEAGRDTEVDHHHVGGLIQVVADRCRGRGDVVLGKMGAVVGDADGENFGGRSFFPGGEEAAGNLVGERARTLEPACRACRRE